MIQQQTILNVSDNSGAKTVKCIKVLGGKKIASLGNIITVSIQELKNKSKINSKVKKGDVCKAIIIRTKYKKFNKDGLTYSFNANSVILLNKQKKLIATRIIGPISKNLKNKKIQKIISISSGFF